MSREGVRGSKNSSVSAIAPTPCFIREQKLHYKTTRARLTPKLTRFPLISAYIMRFSTVITRLTCKQRNYGERLHKYTSQELV